MTTVHLLFDTFLGMIIRMRHGRVHHDEPLAYREFLRQRAVPDYQSVAGNIDVKILERREKDARHKTITPFATQLLKWVGNKQRFAHEIVGSFPVRFDKYFEPFLGSGGILATLSPRNGFASDSFAPLIEIFQTLKHDPERLKQWYSDRWEIAHAETRREGIARCKSRGVHVALSIDGTKKSGKTVCELPIPKNLFQEEIYVNMGRSMLKRFQMGGATLENEVVADRLLLTYSL